MQNKLYQYSLLLNSVGRFRRAIQRAKRNRPRFADCASSVTKIRLLNFRCNVNKSSWQKTFDPSDDSFSMIVAKRRRKKIIKIRRNAFQETKMDNFGKNHCQCEVMLWVQRKHPPLFSHLLYDGQKENMCLYHKLPVAMISKNLNSVVMTMLSTQKLQVQQKETDMNVNANGMDQEAQSSNDPNKVNISFATNSYQQTACQADDAMSAEKVHPALSKRKEPKTVKLNSSIEDFQNEKKKKVLTLKMVGTMCEDEYVKPFQFDETTLSHTIAKKAQTSSITNDNKKLSVETTNDDEHFSYSLGHSNMKTRQLLDSKQLVLDIEERSLPDGNADFVTGSTSNETTSSDEINIEEIKNTARYMIDNSTKKALDFINGMDITNIDGISRAKKSPRDSAKYHSNLSKITEEKEPTEKRKQILKKIYGELCTDYRVTEDYLSRQSISENDMEITLVGAERRGSISDDESEKVSVQYKQMVQPQRANPRYIGTGYDIDDTIEVRPEYETTDEELDCDDEEGALTRAIKKNTIVIPKPVHKPHPPDVVNCTRVNRIPLSKDLFMDDDTEADSPRGPEQSDKIKQKINPKDLIKDIDACLTDVKPPLLNKANMAPNPFPVDKNKLTKVQPPKSDKPKYRRKRIPHNPLLAGVEDDQTVQQTPDQTLGKLKEVQNRQEPTPAIYLLTGKHRTGTQDTALDQQLRTRTQDTAVNQQPMGRLQPKGKDYTGVDSKFCASYNTEDPKTEVICSGVKSTKGEKSDRSDSCNMKYAKMKITFRAREDNLPSAKFWTDLAKERDPKHRPSPEPAESCDDRLSTSPISPIGYSKDDGFHVGVTNSEADLNRFFFQAVASKPQFYKDHGSREQILSSFPLADIPGRMQGKSSTPEENLIFFRNTSKKPTVAWTENKWERKPVSFPNPSRHPEFKVQEKSTVKNNLRSPFNEPPIGSTEQIGRNHPKGAENIKFFLNVSRNPTSFYHQPSGPFEHADSSGTSVSPIPVGYVQQQGYIPDDPGNYVDHKTADDNLQFFKVISKHPKAESSIQRDERNRKNWISSKGHEDTSDPFHRQSKGNK